LIVKEFSIDKNRPAVGIGRIVGYIPEGRIDVNSIAPGFSVGLEFIVNKTGFTELSRCADGQDTSDLAIAAINRLSVHDPEIVRRAKLLVVITQNPDGNGLPHVSARVASALFMRKDLIAFDVGLGCSGWVYGVNVAIALMEMQGIDDGLLVTADPYSKVIDPSDRDTAMLFGDASAVTVLTRRNPRWRVGKCVFGTDGDKANALEVKSNRKLHMNGRGVFEFSATVIPNALEEAMERNGIGWDDIDRVILHQGSRFIVDTIARRIGQSDKTPFGAAEYGNTVSSSIPLMLEAEQNLPHRCILTAGFGVGLSWAVAPLFLNGDQS
jgi:3-oxoacyl-[acyl-carrier-protein] synthase III